jgi:hypothetical protein
MNEIESTDLAIILPLEESIKSIISATEIVEYSTEIEGMLLEIKALKNRLQQLEKPRYVSEKLMLELEAAERSLAKFLENKDDRQTRAEYRDSVREEISDLRIRAEKVIKYNTPFEGTSSSKKTPVTNKDIKNQLDEKFKSYFPIKNIDLLKEIKAKCADNERLYVAVLCKILPINEDSFNLQNEEALQRLELEKECWDELSAYFNRTFSVERFGVVPKHWNVKEFVTVMISELYGEEQSRLFNFKQRVDYLYSVTKLLLDNYGENIKLSLRVTVEGKIIDLFVRLERKRAFALMIRSYEDTSVSWHSEKKDFYVTSKRGKGTDKWNSLSQAVVQLKSVFALKKEKNPVLGVSKAERTAPIIRAIVLAEGTKIDKNRNAPDLWVEFGKAPVLKIATDTLTYIVEQQHLLDFLTFPDPE